MSRDDEWAIRIIAYGGQFFQTDDSETVGMSAAGPAALETSRRRSPACPPPPWPGAIVHSWPALRRSRRCSGEADPRHRVWLAVLQTDDSETLGMSASGTAALETLAMRLFQAGLDVDRRLVIFRAGKTGRQHNHWQSSRSENRWPIDGLLQELCKVVNTSKRMDPVPWKNYS